MRVIKLALLSFIFLFIVIWLISLLIPSHVRISRATDINSGKDRVMTMIKEVGEWRNWYPNLDSAQPIYANGQLTGMRLEGRDSGKAAEIRLEKVLANEVTALFTNNQLRPVLNTWQVTEHGQGNLVTVQWSMDFDLRWYPWEKFASLVLEKSNGQRMEAGLKRLKRKLEEGYSPNTP